MVKEWDSQGPIAESEINHVILLLYLAVDRKWPETQTVK